jgi:hypothetical protein
MSRLTPSKTHETKTVTRATGDALSFFATSFPKHSPQTSDTITGTARLDSLFYVSDVTHKNHTGPRPRSLL